MGFLSTIKALPRPLIVVFGVFLSIPFLSLVVIPHPVITVLSQGPARGGIILAAYWVLPLFICSLCLRRTFALVPLFFIECGLLLLHSIQDLQYQPSDIQTIRYFLLFGMTVFTLTFLNKDVLYPLLAGNQRAWRAAPRLYVQVPMLLWYKDDPASRVPIVLHNCSLTGIGISAPKEIFEAMLHDKESLGAFVIQIGFGSKNWMLNVQLVRRKEEAAILYAGFRVLNNEIMGAMMEEVQQLLPPQHTMKGMLGQYWVRRGFRHAVLALWAVSMASVFMMPSCASVEYREVYYGAKEKGQPLSGSARKYVQSSVTINERLPALQSRALGCVP